MEPQQIDQQSTFKLPLQLHYEGMGIEFVESDGWLLPKLFQDVGTEADLLERGEALVDFSDHGMLRMIGSESVGLLHRISTNDFSRFEPGNLLQTSLLTEKGRVVDSILVLHRGDQLLLFVSKGATQRVQQWIEKFIIMEDVRILHEREGVVLLVRFLSQNDGGKSAGSQYPGFIGRAKYFGQDALLFLYQSPKEALSFLDSTTHKLVGWDAYEYFRIMRGIPEYGREIVPDFNPLELGLWDQVSSTKGCYIGQEVIARLDTYKKIQRSLCTVLGNLSLQVGSVGGVMSGGSEVGRITSACPDLRDTRQSVGLALVRQEHAIPGAELPSEDARATVTIVMVHDKRRVLAPGEGSD